MPNEAAWGQKARRSKSVKENRFIFSNRGGNLELSCIRQRTIVLFSISYLHSIINADLNLRNKFTARGVRLLIYYLGLVGIAAFSITGVIAAGKKGMDIFSIVLLGIVTALGGGTLRDIILDSNPVFWIADLAYLGVSIIAAVATFFGIRLFSRLFTMFLYIDALGLALFTVLATENTIKLGFGSTIAVLMGLITGITGGMIRDILTGRMPLLLGKEFYATPALLGAVFFIVFCQYLPTHEYNRLYAIGMIFLLRILAIQWGLYYPKWLTYNGEKR